MRRFVHIAGTEEIDVLILCGGKGKRLQPSVEDRPKSMADIHGRPFLDILIDYVAEFGYKRFILCLGHMGDFIREHFKSTPAPVTIMFSEEKQPLGTGGAIKNAEPLIRSDPFLVMNGDSLCRADLRDFLRFHLSKRAFSSVIVSRRADGDDYGALQVDRSRRIIAFDEKPGRGRPGFVSAGIYLFQKKMLSSLPAGRRISLERDFFPGILRRRFYACLTREGFMDIGTPERYEQAKRTLGA